MTAWVIWQDTDFCRELWEERLYNAVVGVIYCFCFFNLKEGKSRYRATIFYAIILVENFAFLSVFYFWTHPEDYYKDETFFKLTFVTVIFILETASIAIGLTCMLLYYRYDILHIALKRYVKKEKSVFNQLILGPKSHLVP